MIERFIQILKSSALDLDYRQIEEALWLSRHLPGPASEAAPVREEPPRPPVVEKELPLPEKPQNQPRSEPKTIPAPEPSRKVFPSSAETAGPRMPAAQIRVPAAAALPESLWIARALRPFSRRVDSRHVFTLDEEQTVEQSARSRLIMPVFRPSAERWFDVAFVIEDAPSMVIWQQTIRELQSLFERQGAFRDVRIWRLRIEDGRAALVEPAGAHRDPRSLIDASGRRLVLLLSDCASRAWRDGAIADVLVEWGRNMPVAIAHMLGKKLWRHTKTGEADLPVRAKAPGAPNRLLEASLPWWEDELGDRLPFPVIALNSDLIGRWARMLTQVGRQYVATLLPNEAAAEASPRPQTPRESVNRYRALVSDEAYDLAAFLSIMPLRLPVMRLVHQAMIPNARPEHLAEFLLGGLVRRKTPAGDPCPIDEVEYEFLSDRETREILQAEIRYPELDPIFRSVAKLIDRRIGSLRDFVAWIKTAESEEGIAEASLPFAEIALPALERMGFSGLIRDVEQQVRRIAPEDNAGNPVEEAPWANALSPEMSLLESVMADLESFGDHREEARNAVERFLQAGQDPIGEGWALLALGSVFEGLERYDSCLECYQYAAERATDEPALELSIAWQRAHCFERMGNYEQAIGHLQAAIELAGANDPTERARLFRQIARLYLALADREQAIAHFQAGLELAEGIGDLSFQARILVDLGNVFLDGELYRQAIDRFSEARRLVEDPLDQLPAISGLGHASFRMQDWHGANNAFSEALRIAESIQDLYWMASSLAMLALTARNLQEYARALEYYDRGIEIARRNGDQMQAAHFMQQMGSLYEEMKEWNRAFSSYQEALAMFSALGARSDQAVAHESLARVLEALGQKEQAIAEAEQAIAIYLEIRTEAPEHVLAALDRLRSQPPGLSTFSFETVTLDKYGKEIERLTLTARQFIEDLGQGVTLEMVEIPGGTFLMGSPGSEAGSLGRERPQHEVSVAPFYIGKFTITQEQWRIVAGLPKVKRDLKGDPSRFKGERNPVESISWDDAKEFCARLSQKTGRAYRLPTEAEWEYACRAGTTTPFAFGDTITSKYVNYNGYLPYAKAREYGNDKYRMKPIPVGSLGVANRYGLFDMHGNVWEWCQDIWHESYENVPTDGSAWLSEGYSSYRLLRGGSCFSTSDICRSAYRNNDRFVDIYGNIGVRVVVSSRIDEPLAM